WTAPSATRRSGAGRMTMRAAVWRLPAERSTSMAYEPAAIAAASARPPAWRTIAVMTARAGFDLDVGASPPADRRRARGCRRRGSPHPVAVGPVRAAARPLRAVRALLAAVLLLALLRGLVLRGRLALRGSARLRSPDHAARARDRVGERGRERVRHVDRLHAAGRTGGRRGARRHRRPRRGAGGRGLAGHVDRAAEAGVIEAAGRRVVEP